MADSVNENADVDTVAAPDPGAEAAGATIAEAGPAKAKGREEAGASLLLKVWSAIMFVSTAILGFYAIVLKDNSATPFAVLGAIGLCLPPTISMLRARARHKQLMIELNERIRKAEQERIAQVRERERQRRELEEWAAAKAAASLAEEQEAAKNVDVEAYKLKNSMGTTG